jgi:hypothetical protein
VCLASSLPGNLPDIESVGRTHYAHHHGGLFGRDLTANDLQVMKSIARIAEGYRATLYNLIESAFDINPDTGHPTVSRKAFGQMGREEITVVFQAAFKMGLHDGGVSQDHIDAEDQARITLEIKQERKYWTRLANDLYRKALPLYLEALALSDDASVEPDEAERARLQQEALALFKVFRGKRSAVPASRGHVGAEGPAAHLQLRDCLSG